MEEHFAALKIPDSESDVKLTKAASCSELATTARQIFLDQCHRSGDSPNLVRQYSCEQIFSRTPQTTSQVEFSEVVRKTEKQLKTWTNNLLHRDNLKSQGWSTYMKSDAAPTSSANDQVEYMEVEDLESKQNESTSVLASSANRLAFAAPPIAPTTAPGAGESTPLAKSREDSAQAPTIAIEREPAREENPDLANIRERFERKRRYRDLKAKIRPLAVPRATSPTGSRMIGACCKLLLFTLIPIIVLLIAAHHHHQEDQNHRHSSDFANAVAELKRRVHGQERAVRALSEYLPLDVPTLKVIALVGSTGVGKSYTVEIIKTNFPRAYLVRQYYPPISDASGFAFPRPRLIVLENLREYDLTDVVGFVKARQNDRYVTVLAVFNVERMDDDSTRSVDVNRSLETIERAFVDESIDAKIIPYEPLNEDTLEMCIADTARDSGLTLTDRQIELVKRGLLTNNAGCKGAYGKVQLIGRQ